MDISASHYRTDQESLDKFKRGNGRTPDLSPKLILMLEEAWALGSLHFGATQIRTGFAILALTTKDDLVRPVRASTKEFQKIDSNTLWRDFAAIVAGSREESVNAADSFESSAPGGAARGGKTPNLDQFTVDLTQKAKQGKIDPVLGRDFEDTSNRRHPDASPPEQSDFDR